MHTIECWFYWEEQMNVYKTGNKKFRQTSILFHVVWQIVCDDNMLFRDILVGWPGSVHDARVLRNSSLFATAAAKFPGDTHLLGDGGYSLKM